jgi:lipoyl(octanoyl) transferase
MKQSVLFRDLGTIGYKAAWDYQESLLQANVRVKLEGRRQMSEAGSQGSEGGNEYVRLDLGPDTYQDRNSPARLIHSGGELGFDHAQHTTRNYLLFVEHLPVFTLGKSGNMNNVLVSEERLKERGIEFFKTNRGGDITFHGPAQIVGYPILDLEKFDTDIGHYLRNLEEVIILTLREYGIESGRSRGETGVWIDAGAKGRERKICAIGVRCSRWITMHGFAFNVNTNLNYFNLIIPCGIQNKQVTSLKKELGMEMDMGEVKAKVKSNFEKVFDVELADF